MGGVMQAFNIHEAKTTRSRLVEEAAGVGLPFRRPHSQKGMYVNSGGDICRQVRQINQVLAHPERNTAIQGLKSFIRL